MQEKNIILHTIAYSGMEVRLLDDLRCVVGVLQSYKRRNSKQSKREKHIRSHSLAHMFLSLASLLVRWFRIRSTNRGTSPANTPLTKQTANKKIKTKCKLKINIK